MEIKHPIQLLILVELLYKKSARFAELNKTQLTNAEFTYHLNQLLKLEFVEKLSDGAYALTAKGVHYASLIDYENIQLATLPKCGVYIYATKLVDGNTQILLTRKLRDPNKDKIILPGSKVMQGKTLLETAQSAFKKKINLTGQFKYLGVVHFRSDIAANGYDRIMHIFSVSDIEGDIKDSVDTQNFWVNLNQISELENKVPFLERTIDLCKQKTTIYAEINLDGKID